MDTITEVTRSDVEDLLYEEAALLDAWRLDEWLELFTEDASLQVPATDTPHADPAGHLALVDDDRMRMEARVARLNSRRAHREYPWSRTRRFITNVRILSREEEELTVEASALVYRFRYGHADPFMGLLRYVLVCREGRLLIRRRRAELDMETLSPNGALSMIF
jgi:p-cumate 2,3-dioxygenase beta subunit